MVGIHICQLFYLFILHRLVSLESNVVQHCTSTQNHVNLFRCHSNFCMQHMKSPFPSAERLLDHHSRFCVCTIVGFLGWSSCCCKRCHWEWTAGVPTVPEKNAIIEGAMVILQITANVTDPKDVAIVSTSWPAGNNIGKHAFKSNNIFVEVKARSSSNVLVRV